MSNKQNSSTISNIYTSRNTILELVKERGYDTSDYEDRSINDIQKMYNEKQLDMLLEKKDEKDDRKLFIKYHLTGRIGSTQIYEYIDDLYNLEEILTKDDDFIIITKDDTNDTLKKIMNTIWNKDNIYINIYNFNNYKFNILNHEMVKKHRVVDDNEKNDLMKKYNLINESQFPEISRYDPVAQAIGLRPGQVCEITRKSPTSIVTYYYRICL
jgi:DNA-directed RNA polymerase subunit H (RpoH/RPB5)